MALNSGCLLESSGGSKSQGFYGFFDELKTEKKMILTDFFWKPTSSTFINLLESTQIEMYLIASTCPRCHSLSKEDEGPWKPNLAPCMPDDT